MSNTTTWSGLSVGEKVMRLAYGEFGPEKTPEVWHFANRAMRHYRCQFPKSSYSGARIHEYLKLRVASTWCTILEVLEALYRSPGEHEQLIRFLEEFLNEQVFVEVWEEAEERELQIMIDEAELYGIMPILPSVQQARSIQCENACLLFIDCCQ